MTRNDRIALNHFDEAIGEPLNLAAESCFFKRSIGGCLLGSADIVKDQTFEIQAIDDSRIGHGACVLYCC